MFRDLLSRWVWTGCLIRMVQRQGRRGICRPVRTTFLYSESSAKIGQCDYWSYMYFYDNKLYTQQGERK